MTQRRTNRGVRKICTCTRRQWGKCPHPWHFNFKAKGGSAYRFSIDAEIGTRVESREDAETHADAFRVAIRAGTFRRRADTPPIPAGVATVDQYTVEQLFAKWQEHGRANMKAAQRTNDAAICGRLAACTLEGARFGDRWIGVVTEDDLESVFGQLNGLAAATWNKYRQTVLTMQRWGKRKGYLSRLWLSDEVTEKGAALGRKKGARRQRRLVPDQVNADGHLTIEGEERRLLKHASPWLQRLIIAALETACRRGELLSLQWRDVDLPRGLLRVRAENAKSNELRDLPISDKLRAVLDMVKHDPKGDPHTPLAFVFGTVIGDAVKNPKKTWETAVLKAHGHTPKWKGTTLDADSRARYRAADLHFHDLRHEAGSRLLDQGWPLHHVQAMLGHADAKTTSIYLNVTTQHLQDSMKRFGAALQAVATAAAIDPRPLCNDIDQPAAQVVVN